MTRIGSGKRHNVKTIKPEVLRHLKTGVYGGSSAEKMPVFCCFPMLTLAKLIMEVNKEDPYAEITRFP